MARNNNTTASYWLSIPLTELHRWIAANNRIEQRNRERREAESKRRR